jgi:phospholipid transport system substrate-binding protein
MKLIYVVIIIFLMLIIPLTTYAGDPTDTVKAHVEEVLNVLKTSAAEESKKADIRNIAGRMFDFSSMSKATLGKNWKNLDKDQRSEFIRLLRSMLENAYISKMLGYTDEKAVFIKERSLSETRVEVQSNLVTGNTEIPMHYRMLRLDNQWKVYDMNIEGVSLIKNYRSQFREILAKQSPEELLQIMRNKAGT